jgi:hypothetical protein
MDMSDTTRTLPRGYGAINEDIERLVTPQNDEKFFGET